MLPDGLNLPHDVHDDGPGDDDDGNDNIWFLQPFAYKGNTFGVSNDQDSDNNDDDDDDNDNDEFHHDSEDDLPNTDPGKDVIKDQYKYVK